MKIFLSWSPVPPDPPFWKWIQVEGIVVSIGLLKQERMLEKATLVGLHEFLKYDGCIFLDSGSYEDFLSDKSLRPKSPKELWVLSKWLGVDLVAHSDIPFIGQNREISEERKWDLLKQNIFSAKLFNTFSKNDKKTQIVYVIQGWNEESLTYCSKALSKIKADYYAIGSLKNLQPIEIVRRVKLVREIIGSKPKLHLFAVSNPEVLKKVKSLIDSIDSSTASIAGAMKEIIQPSGKRLYINNSKAKLKCNCPACINNKGAIFLQGNKGQQDHYNRLRKIHNAYQITTRLKEILE